MLLKSCICTVFIVSILADWVRIPHLNPQPTPHGGVSDQYAYIAGIHNLLRVNTLAPISKFSPSNFAPTSRPINGMSSVYHLPTSKPINEISTYHRKFNIDETKSIHPFNNPKTVSSLNISTNSNHSQQHKTNIMENTDTAISTNFLNSIMNNSQKIDKIGTAETKREGKKTPFKEILNTVHRTLLQETPDTVTGKMRFLQDLKTRLYSYMKPRIKRLWGLEDRQARTEKGMSFPSMDGALLTICFLLFAVFLIKLVQQLIQQLQEKANAQAMLMTGIATPVPTPVAFNGRRKRSVPPDALVAARILQLVESFKVIWGCHFIGKWFLVYLGAAVMEGKYFTASKGLL